MAVLKTIVPFTKLPLLGLTTGDATALLVKATLGIKKPLVVEVISIAPSGDVVPIPTCANRLILPTKNNIINIIFLIIIEF